MPTVQLKVWDAQRGTIQAPDFCPYFTTDFDDDNPGWSINIVHASVCQLCRKCTFYTDTPPEDMGSPQVSLESAQTLVRQAVLADQELLALIMKQIKYLQSKDRCPLVVLMSFDALKKAVEAYEPHLGIAALYKVTTQATPIGIVSGIPLYFSDKLTSTPVQVVGEVRWTY